MPAPAYDYLFDIGNVILHFDFGRFARAIAPDCDLTAEDILRITADPKEEMEASKTDTETFLQSAFERLNYRGTRETFIRAWQDIFTLNEPVAQVIETLAPHRRLFLLSNTNQLHVDYFMKEYPVFRHFTDWVFSHEAGSSKPDPAIYRHTIDKLGITPEETVYLDDLPKNIDVGREFGFLSVHYTGQDLRGEPLFQGIA